MILVGALMLGLISFASIAIFVVQSTDQPVRPEAKILSFIGLGGAAVMSVLRFVVPGMISAAGTRRKPEQSPQDHRSQLAVVYAQKTLIGGALLEGAGFLNCVAYITSQSLLNLGAVALLLTIMAVTFPSQTQFENWADQIQRDTL
jgi:hypothetical protein